MNTIGANDADHDGGYNSEQQSCVLEGERHSQHPRSETSFEKMNQSFEVSEKMLNKW